MLPHSEFEDLTILQTEKQTDGSIIVRFKYHFDEDGFSQYDKTHQLVGEISFNNNEIIDWQLEEIHTGIAALKDKYIANNSKPFE